MHSIIKKNHVRSVAPGSVPAPSAGGGTACEKGVRLLSEGGLVHAVEITCSCGEVTLVELDYSGEPASPIAEEA